MPEQYQTLCLFLASCYVYVRAAVCLYSRKARVALALCVLALLGGWQLRHTGQSSPWLDALIVAGGVWCAFCFFAALFTALADCAALGAYILKRFAPRFSFTGSFLAQRRRIPAALCLAAAFTSYGLYEAQAVRPVYFTIASAKLPKNVERFRAAVVADIHLGPLSGPRFLKKIAAIVHEAEPDVLLTIGDLISANFPPGSEEARLLASMRPRLGSYGITGNHEFYRDADAMFSFYQEAGITLLRGNAAQVGPLRIIGVDDLEGYRRKKIPYFPSRTRTLQRQPASPLFTLFLSHTPRLLKQDLNRFDMQISGHLHGGQVWPAGPILQRLSQRYKVWRYAEYAKPNAAPGDADKKSRLLVTRGAGVNGPAIRFLVPPEVVIIDFVHQK